mgnify:CR=1 FL=1
MFLKVVTTALVVFGLALVFAVPVILGQRPPTDDQTALAQYGVRVLTYFAVTCFVWIGAATCAVVLLRRARTEFLDDQGHNINELIEGTLQDHERKQ